MRKIVGQAASSSKSWSETGRPEKDGTLFTHLIDTNKTVKEKTFATIYKQSAGIE